MGWQLEQKLDTKFFSQEAKKGIGESNSMRNAPVEERTDLHLEKEINSLFEEELSLGAENQAYELHEVLSSCNPRDSRDSNCKLSYTYMEGDLLNEFLLSCRESMYYPAQVLHLKIGYHTTKAYINL